MTTTFEMFGETAEKIENMVWEGKVVLILAYILTWMVIFHIAS